MNIVVTILSVLLQSVGKAEKCLFTHAVTVACNLGLGYVIFISLIIMDYDHE